MSIFDKNLVPTSRNTYANPPPSYHHIVRDCASSVHAVKLRIVRNRRNTSTHAFSRRYQPSLPPLYAPVSSGCAAGAATRICRQPDRALTAGAGRSQPETTRDLADLCSEVSIQRVARSKGSARSKAHDLLAYGVTKKVVGWLI